MRTGVGTRGRIAIAIVAATTSMVWYAGVPSASADPPGNNGTVKIAGEDVGRGNEPHVGCTFSVEFFGYDEGELSADLVIEGQAPSPAGTLWTGTASIGEDPAGGGTDLDASVPVDLVSALVDLPQEEQGVHMKLTVHADGSQGADTKHKTFWVACSTDDGGGTPT
jgi:hypothetical protein